MKKISTQIGFYLLMLMLAFFAGYFSVSAQTGTATISTNKSDYPPGGTVLISGKGFMRNEVVRLEVKQVGGDRIANPSHLQRWTIRADAQGNISSQWAVPLDKDALGATFKLSADGRRSGRHAEVLFTDGLNLAALSPTRNAKAVPVSTNIAVTGDAHLINDATTKSSIRVFSQQAKGVRKEGQGGSASVSGKTLTFDPSVDFKPGETVFTIVTAASGLTKPQTYQFTTAAATAAATFTGTTEVPVGFRPYGIAAADVDGDGDLDLLVANFAGSTVSVRLNDGKGNFISGGEVSVVGASYSVAAADVDDDGDLDILATNQSGSVSVRLNDGSGHFTGTDNVLVGSGPVSVAAADLDGDGDLDFLTGNWYGGDVSIRLNNGNGTFSGSASVVVGPNPFSVAAADVDGDGNLDILTANYSSNDVSVSFNNGNGTFGATLKVLVGSNPRFVAAADVDGDGDLDILAANWNATTGNTVSVRINVGGGIFTGTTNVPVGSQPFSVAAADVDGDGDLDILAANEGSNTVSVRLNDGSGHFSGTTSVAVGAMPNFVAAADVDGDGDLDILAANGGSNTVSVRLNQAPLAITALDPQRNAKAVPVSTNVAVTANADFSNDATTKSSIRVFSQQAKGVRKDGQGGSVSVSGKTLTFDPSIDFKPGETVFTTITAASGLTRPQTYQFTTAASAASANFVGTTDVPVGSYPYSVAAVDVDNDGDVDILTANWGSNTVSVRLNDGNGSFSGATNVSVALAPFSVAAADVDGDGDLDMLAASLNSNTVSVRFNDGNGSFSGTTNVPVGSRPYSVAAADVDGDGDLDILAANYSSNTVSVRLNDGLGNFGGTTNVPVSSNPSSTVAADVDGDGDLDILAANFQSNTVSVRLNDGNGNFNGTTNVPVGSLPFNVAAADVDSDGDLDILTANTGSNTVSIRLNDGNGNFTGTTNVSVNTGPTFVAAADVDGDGDLDFLTGNGGSNTVSVRINDGNGNFTSTIAIPVGSAPYSIAVADMDGDRDLDILAANTLSNTVSVRLNQALVASKLAFTQQPTITVAGSSISSIKVQVQDASGNVVTTDNTTQVTLAISTNPTGGTLSGMVTATAAGGIATFNNLWIDKAGSGYTLSATSNPSLTSALSNRFDITPAAASKLVVSQIPTQTVGTSFSVTVSSQDAFGNAANLTSPVDVSLSTATGTGTLFGRTTGTIPMYTNSTTILGVRYDKAESGVSIRATQTSGTPALIAGTSNTFIVNPPPCEPPGITTTNISDVYSAPSSCDATVTFGLGTNVNVTGTSPAIIYNIGGIPITSPFAFPVGITTVTAIATNDCGSDTKTFTVTVTDAEPPTIIAPEPVTANTNTGCTATDVALGTPTTADNCHVASVTNDAPTAFPLGTTTVTWTVKDDAGYSTTATQYVVINDATPPVKPTLADIMGECSATATTPTTTDNCTGTITGTTTDALTYSAQGTHVITWSFDDGHGNVTTATHNVIVRDATSPVKPTLADVTGECSATVTTPTTTDNCTGTITGTTTDALTYSAQGTHVITWSFDDGHGNVTTATQNVIVGDATPPVKPTLADVTGECSATATTATTTDNCTGTITGTTTDALTYSTQGTHVITWSFDDGHGNVTTATQNVIVGDATPPVKPTLADVTGECSATATTPTTTDNCTGTITGTTTDALTYSAQGTHVITWSFDDGHGNVTTATQNVIVKDATPPVKPTLADVTGECSATATTPTTTDNCTGTITGTTTDALTYSAQGTHVITWSFDDGHGNVTTATQNVIVGDATPPVKPTLADVTGECSATATTPTTTDNCTGTITGTTTDALTYSTQGTHVITWSFDDGHGNVTTATQNVIVKDVTAPIAKAQNVTVKLSQGGTLTAAQMNNGSSDNCTSASLLNLALNKTSFTCANLGANTVTLTVSDLSGNSSTATATVTVIDDVMPTITCAAPHTANFNPAICGVTYTVPTTTIADNCSTVTQTWQIMRNNIVEASGSGNVGTYTFGIGVSTISYTVEDGSANTNTCSTTVTVNPAIVTATLTVTPLNPTQATASNASQPAQQYSDKVQFKVTIPNGASNCQDAAGNAATSATVYIGNASKLQMGTVNFIVNGSDLEAVLEAPLLEAALNGAVMAPGNKLVSFTLNSVNNTLYQVTDPVSKPLTITQEDARIDYTGDQILATATATTSTATVTLRANIKDITAVDPSDPNAGDIRKAKVKFVNRETGHDISPQWIPVTILVNSGDTKVGTVSYSWSINLGQLNDQETTVGIIVDNGYYIRNDQADNVVVTVYKPRGDFITGGGQIIPTQSVGSMKADVGSKTNFGFNVRFNRSGTNLQGNMNFIFPRTESDGRVHSYQVKSNAIQSLGVNATDPNRQIANFVSKCNTTDITDPLFPISVPAGKFMFVNMIDTGEPGTADLISFVLVDGSGNTPNDPTILSNIIYSSNWVSSRTQLMNLSSGNIVVHSGFNLGATSTISAPAIVTANAVAPTQELVAERFSATAYPNPTVSQFTIKLSSSNMKDPITLRVIDELGRLVEMKNNLAAGQTIQIGDAYRSGVYFVEVMQGNTRRQLKLIKNK